MTGNTIEVEGAKRLSEMLKMNTTLTKLDLESEKEKRMETRKREKTNE